MTAENEENIRNFVEGIVVATITRPSQRDKQRAPGPSDLASKCDVCVARKIATSLGLGDFSSDNFSLKAWNGTAVHEKLEKEMKFVHSHVEQEIAVDIADIPGVGKVVGHVDLYLPQKKTLVDFKTTDMEKLRRYKTQAGPSAYTMNLTAKQRAELAILKDQDRAGMLTEEDTSRLEILTHLANRATSGVPEEYMGQTMLYAYGLRASGREVEHAALAFIPRDSNNVADVWIASCPYREDVAIAVMNRASRLAGIVRRGAIRELEPHPQCFPCVIRPRLKR
jgi:hypothetical protein